MKELFSGNTTEIEKKRCGQVIKTEKRTENN